MSYPFVNTESVCLCFTCIDTVSDMTYIIFMKLSVAQTILAITYRCCCKNMHNIVDVINNINDVMFKMHCLHKFA